MEKVFRVEKKIIDIVGSLIGLLVFSPIMLALSIKIKLEDGGPVFHRQTRVGKNGKTFQMLKFRSMVVGAHLMKDHLMKDNDADGPIFKLKHDPRVTKIGKFMRKHSLDEIPQFVNVLKGEMSLVGPRPALPEEVEQYQRDEKKRLIVLPGLTGLWQVSGRSNLTYQEMIKLDLKYVASKSLLLDVIILFKTVVQMFDTESSGAY